MSSGELAFTTPERKVIRTKIKLDGEELWAIQPKSSLLINIMREVNLDDEEDPRNLKAMDDFLRLVMEPGSGERIKQRLDDPEDDFDMDTLVAIMEGLQEQWADRPTPPGDASPPPRSRRASGKRSTGNVRSVASTRVS